LNLHGKRVRAGGRVFFEVDVRRRVLSPRKSEYESVRGVLVKIWEILGYPCGKRLKRVLPEVVRKLEGFDELILGGEDKEKLFRMSAATIDRLLKEEKKKTALKGRSHTKPGTLLKRKIPIRTFSEWDETKPGYLEVDLVAHEGGDPRGDFIQTLCAVDGCTGWVEIRALKNKAKIQEKMITAMWSNRTIRWSENMWDTSDIELPHQKLNENRISSRTQPYALIL
jgi:hypothetical protein